MCVALCNLVCCIETVVVRTAVKLSLYSEDWIVTDPRNISMTVCSSSSPVEFVFL